MKKSIHEKRLENPAHRTDEPPQAGNGQCCNNQLLFAMRDNYHEFTLGITTILECLLSAVEHGAVPELPDGWWSEVMNHYHLNIPSFGKG
ncbi:MAG TPA: hypothetical protein DEB25_04705 [Desulfobulbaceae bacterium]|nr:hypothetical protein [Desulfobulbaceae bacterium]